MNNLDKRKILLIISGGIAAYKSLELIRLLKKRGSSVKTILTESAKKFVPSTYRFHFSGCDLVRKFLPKSLAATHNPKSWQEIEILCNRFLI